MVLFAGSVMQSSGCAIWAQVGLIKCPVIRSIQRIPDRTIMKDATVIQTIKVNSFGVELGELSGKYAPLAASFGHSQRAPLASSNPTLRTSSYRWASARRAAVNLAAPPLMKSSVYCLVIISLQMTTALHLVPARVTDRTSFPAPLLRSGAPRSSRS